MLLQLDSEFYEFIPQTSFMMHHLHLGLAELSGGMFVIIISTNAGLWGYHRRHCDVYIPSPFRVVVSGRIKHFISAFGEHVIGKEVEQALQATKKLTLKSVNSQLPLKSTPKRASVSRVVYRVYLASKRHQTILFGR